MPLTGPAARRARVACTPLLLLAAACAGGAGEHAHSPHPPEAACAAGAVNETGQTSPARVRWLDHSVPVDRHELDRWCLGVGVPVVATGNDAPAHLDSLAVITWNVHVGEGRVDSLVADLRSGGLTGSPVEHFVLLVQEARRNSRRVPAPLPAHAKSARRLGDPDGGAAGDVVATARRLGLDLFYVPSMRNGSDGAPAGDRGNAILSTLPLTSLTAIELPLLAQRRVAVAATIPLLDATGHLRELRVTSVHLDYGANRRRPLAPFGPGRTLQAGALAEALAGGGNSVVGGDFNTWSLGFLEGALARMEASFPDLPVQSRATFHTAGVLPRRLDHLFLRAADVSGAVPTRIDHRYGSDHFPVMAWIRLSGDAAR
jgi:endonuclease/exonuclease/phosphatase family metal-dependent hydrolase